MFERLHVRNIPTVECILMFTHCSISSGKVTSYYNKTHGNRMAVV